MTHPLARVLVAYDLRDPIHGLAPWVADAIEAVAQSTPPSGKADGPTQEEMDEAARRRIAATGDPFAPDLCERLATIEWAGKPHHSGIRTCPACGGYCLADDAPHGSTLGLSQYGHKTDCWLFAALVAEARR